MPFYVTNSGPGTWTSASLSLAAGASVLMNAVTLPVDLNAGLVSGQLAAAHLTESPLLTYDMAGFLGAATLLGTTTQYLPLSGANVAPSSSADQLYYPNRAKRLYNFQAVLAVAPGVGKTRTLTVVKNGVDTALTLTFGAAVTGRLRISSLVEISDMETLMIKSQVTGLPDPSALSWSLTMSNSDPLV